MKNTVDYNTLTKAELIVLLEKRDTDITTITAQKQSLEEDKQKDGIKIQELEKALTQCENRVLTIDTAEQLMDAVLDLPKEEVEMLPVLLRTTDIGVEAFTAFNYGILTYLEGSNTDPN